MKYKDGYKYQLLDKLISYKLPIQTGQELFCDDFLQITKGGVLFIKKGYAWDGCSGPTWDDKTNMRAGLIHDALYQFMRNNLLPRDTWKPIADQVLYDIMCEDAEALGKIMWIYKPRAWYYKLAVEKFGYNATTTPKKVYTA